MNAAAITAADMIRAARDGARLSPAVAYLLRVSAATILTYWIAFFLQLPTPYSAVTTVFIVANPVRGAIVSKSAWRLGGTVVGAAAAVVQFALFGQAPFLFDMFMAVWVGLCCAASSLLRFFASYGTVLAGYTVVIVDVGALAHPDQALLTSLDRISVVAIGIVVTGVVFLLTEAPPRVGALEHRVAALTVSLARLVRDALGGEALDRVRTRRRDLSLSIGALEQSIVLAGADSLEVRERDLALRYALTRLSGALSSGVHAAQVMAVIGRPGDAGTDATTEPDPAPDAAPPRSAATARFADGLDAFIAAVPNRAAEREALRRTASDLAGAPDPALPLDDLAAIDQARETVERLERVLDDLDRSHDRRGPTRPRLPRFLDWRSAARNGTRGGLTVALACVFWYATEWPSGPTLLAFVVPAVALLSNLPSPGAAATGFASGGVLAVVAATVFQPVVLPRIDGFPLAVLLLLVFAAPGIIGQLKPRWSSVAFSYLVFFNTGVGLQNPMRFDLATLLNNDEAYLLGAAALVMVFLLVIPVNNGLVASTLAASVRRATLRLARRPVGLLPVAGIGWENVQIQKVVQMSERLALMHSPRRAELVEDAAAGLMVGRLVNRLRLLSDAAGSAPLRPAVLAAIGRIGRTGREPSRTADALAADARALLDGPRHGAATVDAAAMIHEAARLIRRHDAFFANRLVIG